MAFFTEMFGKPKCHSVRSWTAVAATFINKMIFFFPGVFSGLCGP